MITNVEENVYRSTEGGLFEKGNSMLAFCEDCEVGWDYFSSDRCWNCKQIPWKFVSADQEMEEVGYFCSAPSVLPVGSLEGLINSEWVTTFLRSWSTWNINGVVYDEQGEVTPRWDVDPDTWYAEFDECLAKGVEVNGPHIQSHREWCDYRSATIRDLQMQGDMGGNPGEFSTSGYCWFLDDIGLSAG